MGMSSSVKPTSVAGPRGAANTAHAPQRGSASYQRFRISRGRSSAKSRSNSPELAAGRDPDLGAEADLGDVAVDRARVEAVPHDEVVERARGAKRALERV